MSSSVAMTSPSSPSSPSYDANNGASSPQIQQQFKPVWNETLCGCFNDCESACCACFCPCAIYGQTLESVSGVPAPIGCMIYSCVYLTATCLGACVLGGMNRSKMREKYNITEASHTSCFSDYCLHCLCDCCALAQEYRELKYRKNQNVKPTFPFFVHTQPHNYQPVPQRMN